MADQVHFAVEARVPVDEEFVNLIAFLEHDVGDLFAISTLIQQDVKCEI